MTQTTSDVVIVGGGAAGCAVAYYLGKAGVQTTLIEREGVGTQASGWSAGGVNPIHGILMPLRSLALESFRLHQALWDDLKETTRQDCQGRIISMIRLVFDAAELAELEELHTAFNATDGFAASWLEPSDVHALEPRITPTLLRGLALEGNGVVDSFLYTQNLAQAAQHYGATVRAGTVCRVQHRKGRVTGVVLADGNIACESVVLAMGPWAKAAASWLHIALPIEPQKGEIVRLASPGPAPRYDFLSTDVSLFSRPDRQIWCGATEEWRGFDTAPSAAAHDYLRGKAATLMPALATAEMVQHTACLRPVTPDELPIIGQAPAWDNVYLATGGAHKGILLSAAMGKAIADLITTGSTALSISPCAPERFTHVASATDPL